MYKFIFAPIIIFSISFNCINAQPGTPNQVSVQAGYVSEIFFDCSTGNQVSVPKNNWELAFSINAYSAGVHINSNYGVHAYVVSGANTGDFATLDTTNNINWNELYNTDTSWYWGAINRNYNPANMFNYGWGTYNIITHNVVGDSLYLLKLVANGSPDVYYKLWIQSRNLAGDYTFRYATLNNSFDTTVTISKSPYANKTLIYYSLRTGQIVDREPANTDWDITFNRYYADQGINFYYPVVGALANEGVMVAEARGVDVNQVQASNYMSSFNSQINVMGYDWKTFSGNSWSIEDSLTYFIKDKNGAIFQLTFTGYGGLSNGNIDFNLLFIPTSINAVNDQSGGIVGFINNETNLSILVNSPLTTNAELQLINLNGQVLLSEQLSLSNGLNNTSIKKTNLSTGLYFVTISTGNNFYQTKVFVN
ncbi:MAG: T9SS type A sorting domain-containing protein [Bacteroidetes bacterium]|nr:T9SS type A sorting domain-containing protein [Bacteroidota bacterium]